LKEIVDVREPLGNRQTAADLRFEDLRFDQSVRAHAFRDRLQSLTGNRSAGTTDNHSDAPQSVGE
jgi:hypothetical protein